MPDTLLITKLLFHSAHLANDIAEAEKAKAQAAQNQPKTPSRPARPGRSAGAPKYYRKK